MINLSDYKRVLSEYQRGELSEMRFKAAYQTLRSTVSRRILSLHDAGLESRELNAIEALNYYTTGSSDKVVAYSKSDDPVYIYESMISFLQSPFSSKSTYRKGVEIDEDIKKAYAKYTDRDYSDEVGEELTKFILMGGLELLTKIFGNSPEAFNEAESRLAEGISAEELFRACKEYIAGLKGYDEALNDARSRARKRREKAEEYGNFDF